MAVNTVVSLLPESLQRWAAIKTTTCRNWREAVTILREKLPKRLEEEANNNQRGRGRGRGPQSGRKPWAPYRCKAFCWTCGAYDHRQQFCKSNKKPHESKNSIPPWAKGVVNAFCKQNKAPDWYKGVGVSVYDPTKNAPME